MKTNIDGVLVVEGVSDAAFLSSFLSALYFLTDGYNINEEKIKFLKLASKKNKIIILTDSDEAGENIRKRIKDKIEDAYDIRVKPESRKNYSKKGVAESIKEEVLEALNPFVSEQEPFDEEYDLVSLISLSDNPQKKREEIINRFHLIKGNNKQIINQLRILKITKEELWK